MGKLIYIPKDMFYDFLEDITTLPLRKMSVQQTQLMFKVLLTGAMRINEVLQLTPNDILPNGKLRIRRAKGGWEWCKCSQWKHRPRKLIRSDPDCKKCHGLGRYRIEEYAWVTDNVLQELQELASTIQKHQRLFPITDRQALNYANLMDARTHTFRHSWLTWMLESEKMNIRDIKAKARHKNLATTDAYIQSNDDYTRKKESGVMTI